MTKLAYNRCLICPIRGDCCYFSNVIDGKYHIILDKHPCEFLNVETGLCIKYKDRYDVFNNCLSIEEAKIQGALPVGCLYIKKEDTPKVPYKRRINYETDTERVIKRYEYLNNLPHDKIKRGIMDKEEKSEIQKYIKENST